jgi:hypothetical protein
MLIVPLRTQSAPFALFWMFVSILLLSSCSGGGGSSGSNAPALTVTTNALPDAQQGTAYSATLAGAGGVTPYAWKLTSGTLPAGLSLNEAQGGISGTPTEAAAGVMLTFTLTDSASPAHSATATLPLTVLAPLQITSTSLPDGQLGVPYAATLTATGGTAPYTWALSSGPLPAGLSLNTTTGEIAGVPAVDSAATPLSFRVTDAANPPNNRSVNLTLTLTGVLLVITTTSLPYGQLGVAYSATLMATGGTGAVTWAVTSGSLPPGLALNATTGVISGQPTVAAAGAAITFSATDSNSPARMQSAAFTIPVSPANITVAIAPRQAALTVTQTLSVGASTNDNAGVIWSTSASGGSFSSATSQNGTNVTFTAPAAAGVYTLTATSLTDSTRSASITIGVTDLAGVYTYHNDLARDGANTREYALTPANVNTGGFGMLFSCTVDGAIYAQPLWVANLKVAGARHNVVFVATEHDSLYAIDADASPCTQLWTVSLIDTKHGASAGETPVPSGTTGFLVGFGDGDLAPEVGITGTPVIDPATGIMYVVSKSVNATGTVFYQRLHAIDLASGLEKKGSPVNISATYPTDAGGTVTFSAQQENQRAGLTFTAGTVYIAWAAHEDTDPWYGWVMGYTYNGSTFTQASVLNVEPNMGQGGIWMSGGAPSVDSNGHLYLITGNGTFDATNTSGFQDDYGDSFLQLTPGIGAAGLGVSSFFTPSDQANDALLDKDFGSGGAALVLNLANGSPQHLVVGGGKDGALYVLDGDNMGGAGDSNARQIISLNQGIFATAAFWNSTLYLAPVGGSMLAYGFDPIAKMFNTSPASHSTNAYGFPGASPSVSASGASSNGIVWGVNNQNFCTKKSTGCGPAVLHAYLATNLGMELWNSSTIGANAAGNAIKFTVPTIANGKVYVGTRGNNTGGALGSTSRSGELDVYGLQPN